MYHSRHRSSSCFLANAGSMRAIATQWNARSQAANHGYSQVSGIEMTSRAHRWGHASLRTPRAPGRRRRLAGIALEPVLDDVVVELARPQEAGVGLADDVALGRVERRVAPVGVVVVGLEAAPVEDRVEGRRRTARRGRRPRGAGAAAARPRRRPGPRAAYQAAALVPSSSGLTAPASPSTTSRWNASLTYGRGLGWPHSRSTLVSLPVKTSRGVAPPASSHTRRYQPSEAWSARIARSPARAIRPSGQ